MVDCSFTGVGWPHGQDISPEKIENDMVLQSVRMQKGEYPIAMDGHWELNDLYDFSRNYEQVYFLCDSLAPYQDRTWDEHVSIDRTYKKYPWKGGYSAVNFYNGLNPHGKGLKISSIHYASPGWIKLEVTSNYVKDIALSVKKIAGGIDAANKEYKKIYDFLGAKNLRDFKDRKSMLKLTDEHSVAINECGDRIASIIGIKLITMERLNAKTGSALISLKILLSLFRRIRNLVKYQTEGKINFSN